MDLSENTISMIAGALSVLGGGVLGLLGNLLVQLRIERAGRRRMIGELAVQHALTNFQMARDVAGNLANRSGKEERFPPLHNFLLQSLELVEVLTDERLPIAEKRKRIAGLEDLLRDLNAECIRRDVEQAKK